MRVSAYYILAVSLGFSLTRFYAASQFQNVLHENFHLRRAVLLHFIRHMGVYVKRESRAGMSERLLHRLDVVSGADGVYGVCVPDVVESGLRGANRLGDSLKVSEHRRYRQMMSQFVSKHKAGVLPQRACPETLFDLTGALNLQIRHYHRSRRNRAALSALGSAEHILVLSLLELGSFQN